MKDPADAIRTWVYTELYGMVTYTTTVPVYSFAPKDAVMPYILIGEQTTEIEDGSKDAWVTNNGLTIEIYASYTGNDATYKAVNSIAEDVLEILRLRSYEVTGSGSITSPVITGYNVISITLQGIMTDRILLDNYIVVYKSLNINFMLEEQ